MLTKESVRGPWDPGEKAQCHLLFSPFWGEGEALVSWKLVWVAAFSVHRNEEALPGRKGKKKRGREKKERGKSKREKRLKEKEEGNAVFLEARLELLQNRSFLSPSLRGGGAADWPSTWEAGSREHFLPKRIPGDPRAVAESLHPPVNVLSVGATNRWRNGVLAS